MLQSEANQNKKIDVPFHKSDDWMIRNLREYENTLLSDECVAYFKKRYPKNWKKAVVEAICAALHRNASEDDFFMWCKGIGSEKAPSPTWFIMYSGTENLRLPEQNCYREDWSKVDWSLE